MSRIVKNLGYKSDLIYNKYKLNLLFSQIEKTNLTWTLDRNTWTAPPKII